MVERSHSDGKSDSHGTVVFSSAGNSSSGKKYISFVWYLHSTWSLKIPETR
jgi:hypothetical protein